MRITTKAQMFDLLVRGKLGNRFRIWDSDEAYRQAVEDGFDWLVGVRCVGSQSGLPYFHHKTCEEAIEIGARLRERYNCPVRYYEASPDHLITVQGEITEVPWGYTVEYSTVRTHMRAAFASERLSEFSPHTPSIIRRHFDPQSIEDMLELFAEYPMATAEFTAYETEVGELKGRRVVWWEWRHY